MVIIVLWLLSNRIVLIVILNLLGLKYVTTAARNSINGDNDNDRKLCSGKQDWQSYTNC